MNAKQIKLSNAKQIKLSNATINDIRAWTGKSVAAQHGLTKVIDGLSADGVAADMLKAPGKDEPRALYDTVQAAIVLGFKTTVQALLKKETKALSDNQKADKRYWQQQIGSKLKDIRKALARREVQGEESDGAGADKSSWESVKRTVLADMIKQAQGKEASTINNMPAFIKDLQSALARIPANA